MLRGYSYPGIECKYMCRSITIFEDTVLLERIFQFKTLGNEYFSSDIFDFVRSLKVTKAETKYINTTSASNFIHELTEKTKLPLTNYFLTESQIKSILNYKF